MMGTSSPLTFSLGTSAPVIPACGGSPVLSPSSSPGSGALEIAGVWRAHQLGAAGQAVQSTGHAALDAVLPGGGWPLGVMVELLQAHDGRHEWGLLAPALAALQRQGPGWRPLLLVEPPHLPFGPALAACGLDPAGLLTVRGADPAARLWATAQALRCAELGAVLAWLPQARADQLRPLQMAASEHGKPLFVFRRWEARSSSSPAPLRLLLATPADGSTDLSVQVLKRRGPPLVLPLRLSTRPARLLALLEAIRGQAERRRARGIPLSSPVAPVGGEHAVDRTSSSLAA